MFRWRVHLLIVGVILILFGNGIYKTVASPSETAPNGLLNGPAIPGLPSPLRVINYQPDSTFFSEEEDLKIIAKVFNGVVVSNYYVRKQEWGPIQRIIDAGLIPIISFDAAKFLFGGDVEEVRRRTDELIAGVNAAPFPIQFIKVGDELNYGRAEQGELQTIAELVTYLDMTARRLKEAGMVTLLDVTSPELYNVSTDRETYTIAGMDAMIRTGYVDGILMGNPGPRKGDEAVIAQWTKARELWPNVPFYSRSGRFSFTEQTFVESGKNAEDLIRWVMGIPESLGSLGFQLWTWRAENSDGSVSHIRNADGGSNEVWDALVSWVEARTVDTIPPAAPTRLRVVISE